MSIKIITYPLGPKRIHPSVKYLTRYHRCQAKIQCCAGFVEKDCPRCRRNALYKIDELKFCSLHAGQYLISKTLVKPCQEKNEK